MAENLENIPPHLRNVPPQLRKAVDDLVEKSSKGLGVKHSQKPVSVMLPPEIDALVRSLPNRSEFIRQAVIEKLEREHDGKTRGEATTHSLSTLEDIRDKILMRKPPRERGKLQVALNDFIKELTEAH